MTNTSFLNITHLNTAGLSSIKHLSELYESVPKLKEILLKTITEINFNDKKILLKPNWVLNPLNLDDRICLITNENLLLAFLEIILESNPKSIIIGDAPIQGCEFKNIFTPTFFDTIKKYITKYNIPIKIKDFRRTIFNKKKNILISNNNPIEDYLIFDLAENSYLEAVSTNDAIFRVTDYNPYRLMLSHSKGIHKYCIIKDLFESDIIVTIPKVKTHQKTGITNSLKILVGINGDKDFLPHHRVGGTSQGGDCYPGNNIIRRLSEHLLDIANQTIGSKIYPILKTLVNITWRASLPTAEHSLSAAWHGNDTCWRMVLDLNNISIFGTIDGKIAKNPQRELFTLCDGIIAGQGDGPLHPEPLNLGVLLFSNNAALADAAIVNLLGFDIKKIPLVNVAIKNMPKKKSVINFNGHPMEDLAELIKFKSNVQPPPGWIGNIKLEN